MSIQGKKKIELIAETILERISEYDIFRFYYPGKWKLNVATHSPFRKDDNPSFIIGTKHGNVSYIDFAETSKRGNWFNFVQTLYNLSYFNALKLIDKDFGLGISSGVIGDYKVITSAYEQPEELTKKYAVIQAVTRKFTKEELSYWAQYHLDIQDLKENNVYSLSKVYLNKQLFSLKESDLRFGYFYDGTWKIYRPYIDPKFKWVPNNVPISTLEGKDNIVNCDVALVTKSKKDLMVIRKIFPCVAAVQNEGLACFSQENVDFLKANSKKQILSFDSDPTGVKNSKQITELFGFEYLNVPRSYLSDGIKDFADLAKDYGMNALEKILKKKKLLWN